MFDGSVRIYRTVAGKLALEHYLTPEDWASVVAHVSLQGENGNTFYEALRFHQKPTP